MSDLISKKAVEKIIKEFFKTKVDEIPKREKFNKLCDLCDLYLELNADLHKEIEDIPVAYDVDKVVEQLEETRDELLHSTDYNNDIINYCLDWFDMAIDIVKGAVKDE